MRRRPLSSTVRIIATFSFISFLQFEYHPVSPGLVSNAIL